ncbi:putative DNA/RNA endonuclease G, NUC1 [Vibrio nigripulchritudo SO65]|uniref:DNA/RNA non-specific endonuclease n=1 Tax=Vibrio nigripulchritudo TaxID=28173 RepID=UPI0003B1DA42|nr:DNA/RNA non-specific endonuclease [Vibrio nigripulchritudo]CCN37156.1 putative DNA/RNA endonuclease G, NUC1 [Vibrio nigripulchritudo AM115]CCN42637.1 putative DNA/RNA endonuclease G, NUC1 [Vibrio nigripulchritudo FTn2]CCN65568.1 putative DNA/RNA endonuclease G, NUC1 [Vibrio nigripulchritudo POn4]CCN74033.1 putative DNA/RNA endonuclease G, NUC1 [Vibrio nigripulchritudo SO65]
MKKLFLLSITAILSFPTFAQTCAKHLEKGLPLAQSDQILCRDGYAVGYNYNTKNADWVAYHITADGVNVSIKRKNAFKVDQELPEYARSTLADYRGSGYDRGHLAPSATMDFTRQSMLQSFLMSNMSPQLPGFNRNGWRILEEHVRDLANEYQELYVVTGPIYRGGESIIGDGVIIPSAFYKVILDPNHDEAIAFIVPHQEVTGAELESFITTIDEVESQTGLDFFSTTPDTIEDSMESLEWTQMWPTSH